MDKETRKQIVIDRLCWANNMLVDVLSNHARAVSAEGADKLRAAVSLLADADRAFRKSEQREQSKSSHGPHQLL